MTDPERPDPPEPSLDAAENAPVTAATDPAPRVTSEADHGSRAVPILLAFAAVVAAIVTARAALVASDASAAWVDSVGDEQRRGALLQEGARYQYGSQGALAFMVLMAEARAKELTAMAQGQPPEVAARLASEAQAQQTVVDLLSPNSPLVSDPRYLLPSGALDIQRSLADERAADKNTLAIDPMATLAAGDALSVHAVQLMATTVAIGAAFLFGALGQAFSRRRRPLLLLGWIALLLGGAAALAVELGVAGLGA